MKNNLPYFSHDHDARNHPKHKALRAQYGWEGYGRFWALNELISEAEGCRLDVRKPINRACFAEEIGLSCEGFDEFIAFLADPERCGLVNMVNGILTTDRTQEALESVQTRRIRQQQAYSREKGDFSRGKANPDGGTDTEQSILDKTRLEQSRAENGESARGNGAPPAARPPAFSPSEIKSKIAFHPAFDLELDEAALGQLSAKLQEVDCDNLDYIDWVLDRMATRGGEKEIGNPAGYLLTVAGLREWFADWRKEQPVRQALKESRPPPEPAGKLDPEVGVMLADLTRKVGGTPWEEKNGGTE